jgi:hypothetical protein
MNRASMNTSSDARLAGAVRRGLQPLEPASAPDFARTWSRAQRRAAIGAGRDGARQRSWKPALAYAFAATIIVSGVLQWQHGRREDARLQAADYALAVQVAAANGFAVPTDRLLRGGPGSLFRGAPALPAIEYPLMPKESLL